MSQWAETLFAPPPTPQPTLSAPSPHPDALLLDCILNSVRFRISLDPGDPLEELAPRLNHLAASFATPDFTFTVTQGEGRVFVQRDGILIGDEALPSGARILLLDAMVRLAHPERVSQVMLHAGACGGESACVLFAGATHSGKSTLCASLMNAGLLCYSDDTALIDRDFRIAGMPFPLMLREGSWPLFPGTEHLPVYDRWGVGVRFIPSNLPGNSSPAVPAKALVFVEYRPESEAQLDPITTFDALVALEQTGFWVENTEASIAGYLDWLGRLPKYRLKYAKVDDAIPTVRGLLD